MNHRKLLTIGTITILLLGLVFVATPFIKSFAPSAKAISKISRIDISEIQEGNYKFFDHPTLASSSTGYKWAIMAYKKSDDSLKTWNIPMQGSSVGMPDLRWWRQPIENCKNFGPTLIKDVIDETKPIKCHDKKLPPQWWVDEWQWDIDGKSLGRMGDDLMPTKGVIEGDFFVFKKG